MSTLIVKNLDAPTGESIVAPDLQLPSGSVVQVVQGTSTDDTIATSTSYSNTNLSVSITPSSTSNKILLIAHFPQMYAGGAVTSAKLRVTRNGSEVWVVGHGGGYQGDGNSSGFSSGGCYLDSPNSTDELSYVVQIGNTYGVGTVNFRTGFNQNIATSILTVMEIAG
jgi:hypothetical protein